MTKKPFYKGLNAVAIYRRYSALLHWLESMEAKLPEEVYQDMYARLLETCTERIVQLHGKLEAGETKYIVSFLQKKPFQESGRGGAALALQRQRRKKWRNGQTAASN